MAIYPTAYTDDNDQDSVRYDGSVKSDCTVTVSEAKEEIRMGIRAYYAKDSEGRFIYPVESRLPFYLEGPPGIGKTAVVRQIADEMGIGFVSFSVTHHTRNSLIGLPVIRDLEDGQKYTEYTMSEVIASVIREQEKGFKEGILLLDEFNCASQTIMPTMLAFLQTRNIGLYSLPEEWVMVLCGNPREYNNNASVLTPAIEDRVRKLCIRQDLMSFLEYASDKNLHPSVREYLDSHPYNLYRIVPGREGNEVVTCRGWENLSSAINAYETEGMNIGINLIRQYIKASEPAGDFLGFYMLHSHSFGAREAESILRGEPFSGCLNVFNKGGLNLGYNALTLIEMILLRTIEYDKERVVSSRISNVFRIISGVRNADILKERFFSFLTRHEQVVRVLMKVRNREYLEMARRSYGLS